MEAKRVSLVPWGNIDAPDEPRRWGLKVGQAFVCRGRDVLLFDARADAAAEAEKLRARLSSKALGQSTESEGA